MSDCIFCKIGGKELPAKLIYEDADIFAFEDIHPQAPTHLLISPRKHLVSLNDATAEDAATRRGARNFRRLSRGYQ
jgi:histidine triad (HIT) family protein